MKKLFTIAVLGLLTAGSFGLATLPKADATTSSALMPQSSQPSTEESLVSVVVCKTGYVNGRWVECCADHYGNWECWW